MIESPSRRLRRFYTPLVSDTMERLGLPSPAMSGEIVPVLAGDPSLRICGPAFPCRVQPTDEYVEIDTLLEMVDAIPPGSVVVVAATSPIDAALWGGMMSARARSRGAVGAVVNGGVRDIEQIAALDFPVFGTGRSIRDIRRRGFMEAFDVEVDCGGQRVRPGDTLFGDANGVVVIPHEQLDRLLEELERAFNEEGATQRGLIEGGGARELFDRYGRF